MHAPVFCRTSRRHPRSTLFPYTTLFRSCRQRSALLIVPSTTRTRYCRSPGQSNMTRKEVLRVIAFRRAWRTCDAICSRSEEHTSELQSLAYVVCRHLLEKKNKVGVLRIG